MPGPRFLLLGVLQRKEVLLRLGVEQVDEVPAEGEVDFRAVADAGLVLRGQLSGGDTQDHVAVTWR